MDNNNLRDHLLSCRTIGNPIISNPILTIHSSHHHNFTNTRCSTSSNRDILIQGLPSVRPSIQHSRIHTLSLVFHSRDHQLQYLMQESLKNRTEACFHLCDRMRRPQPHRTRYIPCNQHKMSFIKSRLRRRRPVITSTTTRSGGINWGISKGWTLTAWICRVG